MHSVGMDETKDPQAPTHISAADARGGEIILKTRRRRLIFVAGLIGLGVLAILVRLALYA